VVDSGQNAFMTPDEHREYMSTFHTLVEEACCFYRAIFPADPTLAKCMYCIATALFVLKSHA
jgi:hypothetical protein